MPAVSVIVPVYNVEPYFAKCLNSLFAQKLEDIEYIFVDDCSTDRSMEILDEVLLQYPNRHGQVKRYRMPVNSGQAAVRIQGIDMATGEYVIHCDSDDWIDLSMLQRMYEKAYLENADIVACDFRMVYDFCEKKDSTIHQICEPGKELSDLLSFKIWGSLCCNLIRRTLLAGLIPPQGNMWEDMVIYVQALIRSTSRVHVALPLYTYYRRVTSITMESTLDANISRWQSMVKNAEVILSVVSHQKKYSVDESVLIKFKYGCRTPLRQYVHIREYYKKWCDTFPEIDSRFLFTKGISLADKFWFVLIHIQLYGPWKKVSRYFRNNA